MKNLYLKSKLNSLILPVAMVLILSSGFTSCTQGTTDTQKSETVENQSTPTITEQEVLNAQKAWGEGIVEIGKVYSENGDYVQIATEHINKFYNYQGGTVLFKPTLAAEKQFRTDFDGALSYFVGENETYAEDKGFALRPWSTVRWENIGTKIIGNMAVAMGNYYFTPAEGGDPVKVEYSFAYTKNDDGQLKIILHGSHLPYNP